MRRGHGVGTLVHLAWAAACWGAQALAQEPPIAPADLKKLQSLVKAVDANDCNAVIKLGTPIIDGKSAPTIPPKTKASIYNVVVPCEVEKGDRKSALAHAQAGTLLNDSSNYLWRYRLWLALELKMFEEAVVTVEAMTRGRGAALNNVPIQWLYSISRQLLDPPNPELRERLLKVVTDPSYMPDAPDETVDGFRYSYATILAERGDKDAASAQIGQIENPDSLIDLSLDPRTRALLPADFDVRAVTEKKLRVLQQKFVEHPRRLSFVNDAAMLMRRLGRYQDSLTLLRSVEGKIADPKQWEDADQIVWWWDGVARTLASLDRYAEAVAAFRKGAELNEGSTVNVSQVINLSTAQLVFGHPADALVTLAAFDDPARKGSPYGEMQMRLTRGCARYLVGHQQAQADLEYMVAHERDAPAALTGLFLCRGDLDGAAASMIRRLDNPDQRVSALQELSDFDPPPVQRPTNPYSRLWPDLKARPDVKAAVARAGGTRRFRIQEIEL